MDYNEQMMGNWGDHYNGLVRMNEIDFHATFLEGDPQGTIFKR